MANASIEASANNSTNPQRQQWKRWYDDYPSIHASIPKMESMPLPLMDIMGEGLVFIAERYYDAETVLSNVKSLGREKVLPLYKSTARKRCYDRSFALHKFMNYVSLMAPEDRSSIGERMVKLLDITLYFLKYARDNNSPVTMLHCRQVIQCYAREGERAALALIEQKMVKKNNNAGPSSAVKEQSSGSKDYNSAIKANDRKKDMHVRSTHKT